MENPRVYHIRFVDLSVPLKVAVVAAYAVGGLFALVFIIGFVGGIII